MDDRDVWIHNLFSTIKRMDDGTKTVCVNDESKKARKR